MGGLAGKLMGGNVSVSGVTSNVEISYTKDSGKTLFMGGFFGNGDATNLTISSCTTNAVLTTYMRSFQLGGFAGKLTVSGTCRLPSNTTSAKITTAYTTATANSSCVGGIISTLTCTTYQKLNMEDTIINGVEININGNVTSGKVPYCGGFVGYQFNKCEVILNKPVENSYIHSPRTITVGTLISILEGKLVLDEDFAYNNVSIDVGTSSSNRISLCVYDLKKGYMAIRADSSMFDGITYKNADATYTVNDATNSFDLFAASSLVTKSQRRSILTTGGIVTIETDDNYGSNAGIIPLDSPWIPIISKHNNSSTRYYFNVEELENKNYNSNITDESDLMYFSVWSCLNSELKTEYITTPVTAINASRDMDMSGRCYFPATASNISVNFNNHKFIMNANSYVNSTIKSTLLKYQFNGLGNGLFLECKSVNSGDKVTVKNIVFSGTFVNDQNNSGGVLVCDTITGVKVSDDDIRTLTVELDNIFFDNVTLYRASSSGVTLNVNTGLMINRIDSYVSISISHVSQYTQNTYLTANKTNTYSSSNKGIAYALIDQCGKPENPATSTNVNIKFNYIVFDGKTSTSIFNKASLFRGINLAQGASSITYNFNYAEDWNGSTHVNAVTYGKELTTNEEQYLYFDSETLYVSSTSNSSTAGVDSNIANNYLVYVATVGNYSAVSAGNYNDSLSVNRKTVDLITGWGTFNNPYAITSPNQLELIGSLLSGDYVLSTDWKINYPTVTSSGIDYTTYEGYTYNGTSLVNADGDVLAVSDLISYLQGAYYTITVTEIEMSSNYLGLGSKSNPFHGVVSGMSTGATIKMEGNNNINTNGYGFVNVANGCAIYNLAIIYDGNLKLDNTNFTTTSSVSSGVKSTTATTTSPYFGGVIGFVVGGDSVIDTVTVTITGTITPGSNISAFGGYVGLVTAGGVALNNIGESTYYSDSNIGRYFYNPYVGKVNDGYVISFDKQYNNSDKNYYIPYIHTTEEGDIEATVSGSNVSFAVEDGEELLILSMAINSGSFAYNASQISYGLGALNRVSNYLDYHHVGESSYTTNITNGRHSNDTFTTSYLSSYFTNKNSIKNIVSSYISINLTGSTYNLEQYHNGFRTISGAYRNSISYKITAVTGISTVSNITVDMEMINYYNTATSAKDPDSMVCMGLIGTIEDSSSYNLTLSNIHISGNITLNYVTFNSTANSKTIYEYQLFTDAGSLNSETAINNIHVGSLIGRSKRPVYLSNITVEDAVISSPDIVGGVIGTNNQGGLAYTSTFMDNVTVTNSSINSIRYAGGVVGLQYGKASTTLTVNDVEVSNTSVMISIKEKVNSGLNDVGGVYGRTLTAATYNVSDVLIQDCAIFVQTSQVRKSTNTLHAGGFTGYSNAIWNFTNIVIDGCVIGAASDSTSAVKYPLAYTNTGVSITDSTLNIVSGLLSYETSLNNPDTNWYDGTAAGIIGYQSGTITATDVSIKSTNHSTIIIGCNNVGGITADQTGVINFTNCDITSTGHDIYLVATTRVGGIVGIHADSSGAVGLNDCDVVGTEENPIYLLTTRYRGASGSAALVTEAKNQPLTINNSEVGYCYIGGTFASGVSLFGSGALTMSNIEVHDCFVIANRSSATASSASTVRNDINNTTYINGAAIYNNTVITALSNDSSATNSASAFVNTVSKPLYVNFLITSNNTVGSSTTFIGYQNIINNNGLSSISLSNDRTGYYAYKNSNIFNILALFRKEEDSPAYTGEDIDNNAGTYLCISAGYNAIEKYIAAKGTANELTPEEAINAVGYFENGLNFIGDSNEDPVGINDQDYRENHIDNISSMISTLRESSKNDSAAEVPVVLISGNTDDSIRTYIEYLIDTTLSSTNVTITSSRYILNDDGTISIKAGVTGSIYYQNKIFYAGLFDNLENEDEAIFTVLTLTFTNKSSSSTNASYTMNIIVYYPQILEMGTFIIPVDNENYQISAFKDKLETADPYTISISSSDDFSLYLEYQYNSVAESLDEFNFDKYLYSTVPDGSTSGVSFPTGTKFILVDLNNDLPSGYKIYYYICSEAVTNVMFSSFEDAEGNSYTGCQKYINELPKNASNKYVESYLLLIDFPTGALSSDNAYKYTLKAAVGANDKNIIVEETATSKRASVEVWKEAEVASSSSHSTNTNGTFSNNEMVISENVSATVTLPSEYVASLTTPMYGVYAVTVRNNTGTIVQLPNGTTAKVYDSDGTLLLSKDVSNTKTFSYSVGDIIDGLKKAGKNVYTSSLRIELDFSNCDPAGFRNKFNNNEYYDVTTTFYYSNSSEHYSFGESHSTSTVYQAIVGDNIKLSVTPTSTKNISINVNSIEKSDKTNNGVIEFNLVADFSSCVENMPTKAKYTFAIYEKEYNSTTGKFEYNTSVNLLNTLGSIYNGSSLASSYVEMEVTAEGVATGTLTLKLFIKDSEGNVLSTVDMSNYQLVVTVKGYDNDGNEVTESESNYFIFQICDIMTEPS